MATLRLDGPEVAQWLAGHFNEVFCPPFYAFGWERDGEIIAAVLFNQFEGWDVAVTAAGTGWTRRMLREIGVYAYSVLGAGRITLTTESETVAKYAERLGAVREGVLRNHFGKGRNGIVLGILKDEYLYLT
jgi:RimJ/RimL family protein N-acetyltransferase